LSENPDKIENILFSSLMDGAVAVPSSQDRSIKASTDPLASSTWEEVLVVSFSNNVLITKTISH